MRGPWSAVSVAAVLLCVASSAACAGLQGADLRRGPVPALARQYAEVTAELEVSSDPRLTRSRISGDHAMPPAVLIDAWVSRVTQADGTATATRAPVRVIVDTHTRVASAKSPGDAAKGPGRSPWLSLLPSTRLRVTARLVPRCPAATPSPRYCGSGWCAARHGGRAVPDTTLGGPVACRTARGHRRARPRRAGAAAGPGRRGHLPCDTRVGRRLQEDGPRASAGRQRRQLHHPAGPVHRPGRTGTACGAPGVRGPARHPPARDGTALRCAHARIRGRCRPDPSVLRAAACGAIALLALASGRRRSLLPALATAVLCWCSTIPGSPAAMAFCSPCWPPAPCSPWPRAGARRCEGAAFRLGPPRHWPPRRRPRRCALRSSRCSRRG